VFERHRGLAYWLLGSAAAMIVGSFGPWASVLGMSVSGTDGSNDGWLVVAVAGIGALGFYLQREKRSAAIGPLVGGLAGLVITLYDRSNMQNAIDNGGEFAQALAHVGWGLNVALAGSLSMTVAAVVWWKRARGSILAASTPE